MDNIFVGEKLTKLRKLKGRTQSEVAKHFGITKQAVSKWENGIAMPDVLLLPELASYFDVHIDYFFEKKEVQDQYQTVSKNKVVVTVRGLKKVYDGAKTPVLKGIDLDIHDAASTAIMGPSGCGKTTLVNCISCLESITEGSIEVFGRDIAKLKEPKLTDFRRKKTSYIFQQYNLVEVLNVIDNIKLPYKMMRESIDKARLKELIAKLGLEGLEKAMPHKLSGGQQQRVAIARALLGKGRLILADEPTGALDLKTGKEVLQLLLLSCKEFKTPVIIITHDSQVAAQCDIVHFMLDGRIVRTMEHPAADEVAKVMIGISNHE